MLVHIESVDEFEKSIKLAFTKTDDVAVMIGSQSRDGNTDAYLVLDGNGDDPKAYLKSKLLKHLQEIGLVEKTSMTPFFARRKWFGVIGNG